MYEQRLYRGKWQTKARLKITDQVLLTLDRTSANLYSLPMFNHIVFIVSNGGHWIPQPELRRFGTLVYVQQFINKRNTI